MNIFDKDLKSIDHDYKADSFFAVEIDLKN